MASPEDSHVVLPPGSHPRGVLRWGYFLVLNAIAGVIAVAIFAAVLYADALDPYLRGTYDWLLSHPGATSVMAFSPLACSLLVGWGYAQRARRRKAIAAAQAARLKGDEAVSHG
jgi:H+/Cl- antiporter ClcA